MQARTFFSSHLRLRVKSAHTTSSSLMIYLNLIVSNQLFIVMDFSASAQRTTTTSMQYLPQHHNKYLNDSIYKKNNDDVLARFIVCVCVFSNVNIWKFTHSIMFYYCIELSLWFDKRVIFLAYEKQNNNGNKICMYPRLINSLAYQRWLLSCFFLIKCCQFNEECGK